MRAGTSDTPSFLAPIIYLVNKTFNGHNGHLTQSSLSFFYIYKHQKCSLGLSNETSNILLYIHVLSIIW